MFDFLKSKTIWGAVLTAFGYVAQPEVLGVLPEPAAAIVSAIGLVLTAFGIKYRQNQIEQKVDVAVEATALRQSSGKK